MRQEDKWNPNDDEAIFHERPTPAQLLAAGAETFAKRNGLYGDSYLVFGQVMVAMLPGGIELSGEEAFNRFGVFAQCVGKLTRYAANLQAGGHQDSAHDLCVYAAMLESITADDDATHRL